MEQNNLKVILDARVHLFLVRVFYLLWELGFSFLLF